MFIFGIILGAWWCVLSFLEGAEQIFMGYLLVMLFNTFYYASFLILSYGKDSIFQLVTFFGGLILLIILLFLVDTWVIKVGAMVFHCAIQLSPFQEIGRTIRFTDYRIIPVLPSVSMIPYALFGTIYAVVNNNICLLIPNILGLISGSILVIIWAVLVLKYNPIAQKVGSSQPSGMLLTSSDLYGFGEVMQNSSILSLRQSKLSAECENKELNSFSIIRKFSHISQASTLKQDSQIVAHL